MLLSIILLPILGSIIVASIDKSRKGYDLLIRQITLTTSVFVWIISSIMSVNFIISKSVVALENALSTNNNLLQFKSFTLINDSTSILSISRLGELNLGLDGLSLIFVILTAFLIPIAILSSYDTITHNPKSNLILLLLLESILFIVFSAQDLIVFYVSFETVLIPLFIIIGLHGSTDKRTRASMLLFLYTLLGSFFMLLGIMQLFIYTGTTDMSLLSIYGPNLSPNAQRWIWLGVFFSIAIKSPLVPFHGWLFRAHAESSLAGSILLAGIVLKLATYAYIRILIPILPDACEYFRPLVLTISCLSLIHGSLATIRQVDSKVFVAYSSVGHMAIVILGLGAGTLNGIEGAILLSVAHGLVSPALFVIVGGVLYDRFHTRIIRYYRGTGSFMPSMKTWFFLASVASMAVPGSLNWIGELLSILGSFEVAPVAGILGTLSVLLGAIYTIWMYNQIAGGHPSPYLALMSDLTFREWTMLVWLIVPAFILGIFPNIINSIITINTINIAL